ncbi:MAG: hypothetical protein OHK0039_04310 [Bacteroidia bacterium]
MSELKQRQASYEHPWLYHRYAYDERARHRGVEAACLAHLAGRDTLHLVDCGAGNGANLRYFFPKIAQRQHWTLVEQDPKLLAGVRQWLADWGAMQGWQWEVTVSDHTTRLHTEALTVSLCEASLLDVAALVPMDTVDLLLANAVFDLFTEAQFDDFAGQLAGVPLLATLNYCGMTFSPTDGYDRLVVGYYEAHMNRPQPAGRAMGKYGPLRMADVLARHDYTVHRGDSVWQVGAQDQEMMTYLLGFMEEAVPELPLDAGSLERFGQWVARQRLAVADGRLALDVYHEDLFACR